MECQKITKWFKDVLELDAKAADIVVYTDNTKETPKIIIEVKQPKRQDGIEQLIEQAAENA
jgi:hypothetical protein